MKKILLVLLILINVSGAQAQGLRSFLKSCAWGTMAGAAAGVVSLAFTDKPGESWQNVAKGASLGLYAGIGYGLYQSHGQQPATYQQPEFDSTQAPVFIIEPQFEKGQVGGVQVSGVVWSF